MNRVLANQVAAIITAIKRQQASVSFSFSFQFFIIAHCLQKKKT